MLDLFETPELIPSEVQAVLDTFLLDSYKYGEIEKVLEKVEKLGYTFDYYLDGDPYGLRPVGMELNQLDGYGEDN